MPQVVTRPRRPAKGFCKQISHHHSHPFAFRLPSWTTGKWISISAIIRDSSAIDARFFSRDSLGLGAWLGNGLGSENENLPAFSVLVTKGEGGQPLLA